VGITFTKNVSYNGLKQKFKSLLSQIVHLAEHCLYQILQEKKGQIRQGMMQWLRVHNDKKRVLMFN
jgi:hypothetical protein